MQAKKFKNFTTEDFVWAYGGIVYTFKAGEDIYLEDFKADHFAKHLVDRELTRQGKQTNDLVRRAELLAQCFPETKTVSSEKALDIESRKKEAKADSREGITKEEEFPDLKVPPESKKGRPKKEKEGEKDE